MKAGEQQRKKVGYDKTWMGSRDGDKVNRGKREEGRELDQLNHWP